MAVVEDIVRVPGLLDPQQPGVSRPPVSLGEVYGLTAGGVAVLELGEFLHPRVEAQLLLQFPHSPGTPGGVTVSEQATEVPLKLPKLGCDGDPFLCVVSKSDVVVEIETEPTKITASFLHNLLLREFRVLPKDRVVEEQRTKVQRVLHPVHGRGGDVETAEDVLLREGEEPVLVVTDSQVTWSGITEVQRLLGNYELQTLLAKLEKKLISFGISSPSFTL